MSNTVLSIILQQIRSDSTSTLERSKNGIPMPKNHSSFSWYDLEGELSEDIFPQNIDKLFCLIAKRRAILRVKLPEVGESLLKYWAHISIFNLLNYF